MVQEDVEYMLRSTQVIIDAILARRYVPPALDPTRSRPQGRLPGTPGSQDVIGSGTWPTLAPERTPRSASKYVLSPISPFGEEHASCSYQIS